MILGCTRKSTTALNTVTVPTDTGVKGEIKLLIDTWAELCLLKHTSTKYGTVYRPDTTPSVRSISNEIGTTLGEVNAKLKVGNYETKHKFQVTGGGINIPYDGILRKDFIKSRQATIDYMRKEIIRGKVTLKFDKERQLEKSDKKVWVVLKPRCETTVKLRTRSRELETGLIDRAEIAPGVIIA
jgi:hypothetical protein